jgi:hypothetical protein
MAKPDKRYDLSRYINNALSISTQGGMISGDSDTDNDNYLLAQSVMDLEPTGLFDQEPDPNLVKWLSHAKMICGDVIKLMSDDSDSLMIVSDDSPVEVKMSLAQTLYLLGLMYQLKPFEILDRLHLAKICPALWAKSNNKVYSENLEAVKMMNAEQVEAMVTAQALNNPNANIERMFFTKAWIARYRDNAPLPAAPSVVIRVTIDGQPIDTGIGRRLIDITEDQRD